MGHEHEEFQREMAERSKQPGSIPEPGWLTGVFPAPSSGSKLTESNLQPLFSLRGKPVFPRV